MIKDFHKPFILVFSLFFALAIYAWVNYSIPQGILQTIRLTQIYSFSSITFLFLYFLADPLTQIIKIYPANKHYLELKPQLIMSVLFFAILHGSFAFWGQLGGFAGLLFLGSRYLLAITLSFTALLIISASTIQIYSIYINKIKFINQKILDLLLYLASILILIHALMLGTHFQDLSEIIPQLIFVAVGFLLILESLRLDAYLKSKNKIFPKVGISVIITCAFLTFAFFRYINPSDSQRSFGLHAEHIRLAQVASKKIYNVNLIKPETINPNEEVELIFEIFDENNKPVLAYNQIYDKLMHLIIVNDNLDYYQHLHPEKNGNKFSIKTSFPDNQSYHLYIDFMPSGNVEKNKKFFINIGSLGETINKGHMLKPDTNLSKQFGDYIFTLKLPKLEAIKMNNGEQQFKYTIKNLEEKDVTTLEQYLSAFGHMVMINSETFQYIHVHPDTTPADPMEKGGPEVSFIPLPIYGEIKPGIYKVFAQFNPDGNLILTEFIVNVE